MRKKQQSRELDKTDLRILRILQDNGRVSNVELAKQAYLTPTPCLERVRRLEREGYIEGYHARLDPHRLGLTLVVFIQVRLDQTGLDIFDRFREAVLEMPEVTECYMVPGAFDFLLKIRVPDIVGYRRFMAERLPQLPGVVQTYSHVVMEEIKQAEEVPIDETRPAGK